MTTRDACLDLDLSDPLSPLREQFRIPAGLIYLDGNSLGVLPKATPIRVAQVVQDEWGDGLIRSWNTAGWMDAPRRVGDKLARLVGAAPGELVMADSTSVNLYKVLGAAFSSLSAGDKAARPVLLSERSNFPTDLYIADALARQHGCRLELADAAELPARLQAGNVAILLLTQVNYRTGALHDMAALTAQAQAAGALTVWDLAHSAGALPVDLNGANADFAVGCGYKYLNGGPGAPAFVWVNARLANRVVQPLAGWLGHAAPFRFDTAYEPAPGIQRFLCGTPSILGLAALECGLDTVLAAEPYGGLQALRAKSIALTELFIGLVDRLLAQHGLSVASPRQAALRGSQVSLAGAPGGQAVMQALIARGVIGDYRAGDASTGEPDLLRFGFTPLYTRFTDVWDAVAALGQVLGSGEWQAERFAPKGSVT